MLELPTEDAGPGREEGCWAPRGSKSRYWASGATGYSSQPRRRAGERETPPRPGAGPSRRPQPCSGPSEASRHPRPGRGAQKGRFLPTPGRRVAAPPSAQAAEAKPGRRPPFTRPAPSDGSAESCRGRRLLPLSRPALPRTTAPVPQRPKQDGGR